MSRWTDPSAVGAVAAGALRDRGVARSADVADVLVESSLLGVHTHGVRLLGTYLDELDRGVADAAADLRALRDTGPVVQLDAADALGVVAGLHAAELAAERAAIFGVAVVGVTRSNHFGAAGCYARRIAATGLLGLVTTSAAARVAPFSGADPLFGTNPIAAAFGPDFVLDMATSQVCFGEIKERARTGDPLEPGWAVGANGAAVTEPSLAAALAPLGGYKGQGLAMLVTVLTSVMVGGPSDTEMAHIGTSTTGRGVAHLMIAIDPAALGGTHEAGRSMRHLVERVRASRPATATTSVLVPGDPQHAHRERQLEHGLELDDATVELLDRLAVA